MSLLHATFLVLCNFTLNWKVSYPKNHCNKFVVLLVSVGVDGVYV